MLEGLPPAVSAATRIVVLGSFPSAASLAAQQYYAHPRNHFWPIMGALLCVDLAALPYPERVRALMVRGVGLWDVYARCERRGSLDVNIHSAELNDLASLKQRAPQLRAVAHNGGESARNRRHTDALGLTVWKLPSSSPANATWSLARKIEAWREAMAGSGVITAAVKT
jgi:double-stranded uracil-DNA glycosylase